MSLRSKKQTKYNRALDVEERQYWLDLCSDYVSHWYEEDEYPWGNPWEDNYDNINSMNELYQMRLVVLLRKLSIKTAEQEARIRYW